MMVMQSQSDSRVTTPVASGAKKAIEYARLLFEKCELRRAKDAYLEALEIAKSTDDRESLIETLSGLLRLAAEARDAQEIERWERELDSLIAETENPALLSTAWYCKGVVASYASDATKEHQAFMNAMRFSRAVLEYDQSRERIAENVKIWSNLAANLIYRGRIRRAMYLVELLLSRYEADELPGINGPLYILKGMLDQRAQDFEGAMKWYQKAHSAFLKERNWFSHLYVLYAYARISRMQRNYQQAYWYLDLMDKATSGPEFGHLRNTIREERHQLETDAIDLLIDSRRCEISTREAKAMPIGKQYVLLGILEALTDAHGKDEPDSERGLSKAEIIERVWKEKYRPEAHDNKLYYNINRLRKLIEPDMKHPQYLLNWKEGYRLAPGLRVHFVGGSKIQRGKIA